MFRNGRVDLGKELPKDIGAWDVALFHRRLSILDLSPAGWQPMGTGDGRYFIVYNGEIYNYLEIRRELEGQGYKFKSNSDTEVLLYGYAHWGAKVLERLIGMFAFAILDTHQRKVFVARDFFGIKPLYFSVAGNGFAFSSEIPPLFNIPGIRRTADPIGLYPYLRHGTTDYGRTTLFRDVQQLPAAHCAEISLDKPTLIEPRQYWSVNPEERIDISFEQAVQRTREMFLRNVGLHLRSDVPVGAALSGGIDSSSIVMAMRHLQGDQLDLRAISYIAPHPEKTEEKWVDIVSAAARANTSKISPGVPDLVADLDKLIKVQGEPFFSPGMYVQYRIFEVAKRTGVKVMLDGQGADEILAGYTPYLGARFASLFRQLRWLTAGSFLKQATQRPGITIPWILTRSSEYMLPPSLQNLVRPILRKELMPDWIAGDWFRERGARPIPTKYTNSSHVLGAALRYSVWVTSLPSLLRYEDRNSMAWSVESRVPFLTHDFVSFLLSLPEEYIVGADGTSKSVFREAMRGIVPDSILQRKDKIGFETPDRDMIFALRETFDQTFASEEARRIPAIHLGNLRKEWDAIKSGKIPFDLKTWRWFNLVHWSRHFEVSYE